MSLGDRSTSLPFWNRPNYTLRVRLATANSGVQGKLTVFWGSKSGPQKINKWYMNKMRGKRLFLNYINGKDTVSGQGAKEKTKHVWVSTV